MHDMRGYVLSVGSQNILEKLPYFPILYDIGFSKIISFEMNNKGAFVTLLDGLHTLEWYKVHKPNLVPCLNRTPIFEWHVVMCDTMNGYKKMSLKEIGLHAQNMITIIGSYPNIISFFWGGFYMIV